jgi:predicted phosphodiesterase
MEAAGQRFIWHSGKNDWIKIWGLGDTHIGNRGCAIKRVKRDIQEILNDPYSFWVGTGDYIDCIGYSDKRFDPDSISEDISVKDLGQLGKVLIKKARDLFYPIRHKCLGLIIGNHEKKYEIQKEQRGLHNWLCVELEVPNLEYSALFDIVFCKVPNCKEPKLMKERPSKPCHQSKFRFYVHHGCGYATTEGGKLNKLIKKMTRFDADAFIMGHVHDQTGKRISLLGANSDCTKLIDIEKLGIITGTYLKTYGEHVTTYAEERGYDPVPIGARWISVQPYHRKMRGQI